MNYNIWQWFPGKVDLSNRYFELKYGHDPSRVARIGIGENNKFIVEFLINLNDDIERQKKIFSEVIWEIELYLINNSEPDPIEYMINHTRKCANLYSRVHWNYFSEGSKKGMTLRKSFVWDNPLLSLTKLISKI